MAATAPDPQGLLESPVRRRILDELAQVPPTQRPYGLSVADLAARVGLHVTTVRFHLNQLVGAGWVTVSDHVEGVGRPRKFYAAAQTTPQSERYYKMLAELLAQAFTGDAPVCPEEAGFAWAQEQSGIYPVDTGSTSAAWLAAVGAVLDVMNQWGYEVSLDLHGSGDEVGITLYHCPFRDLAAARPDVVCALHRGLIRGATAAAGQPGTEVTLDPFVQDSICHGRLRRATPLTLVPTERAPADEGDSA